MSLKPIAWARKWFADGEVPAKERNQNGRLAWPKRFLLKELTANRVVSDDVALYPQDVVDQLQAELAKADNMLKVRAEQNEEFGQLIEQQHAELAEVRAKLQLGRKLLSQSVAALNPRNRLAAEIRDFMLDKRNLGLCEDEGCPHHGTDHVCVEPRRS